MTHRDIKYWRQLQDEGDTKRQQKYLETTWGVTPSAVLIILIIISVIAFSVDFFEITKTDWFKRTGPLMVTGGNVVQILMTRPRGPVVRQKLAADSMLIIWASENMKDMHGPKFIFLILMGTLIWGYGDLIIP